MYRMTLWGALAFVICLGGLPRAHAQTSRLTVGEVIDSARILIDRVKADSALALIRPALETDTANFALLSLLAEALNAKQRLNEAIAVIERSRGLRESIVATALAAALKHYDAGRLDSAAYYASSALSTSQRRSPEAYYWLGRIHEKSGRPDSALVYYRGALSLLPDKGVL